MNGKINKHSPKKKKENRNPPIPSEALSTTNEIQKEEKQVYSSNKENSDSQNTYKPYSPPFWIRLKRTVHRANSAEWTLVVISIILAIANIVILKYASDQAKAAIDSANSAKESAISADNARKENRIIEEKYLSYDKTTSQSYTNFTKTILRPQVILDKVNLTEIRSGVPIFIHYEITNTGFTPAQNIRFAHTLLTIDLIKGREEDINFVLDSLIDVEANKIIGTINRQKSIGHILGNNSRLNKDIFTKIFTRDDSIAAIKRMNRTYLIGLIKYLDKSGIKYETWFCLDIYPNGTYTTYSKYNSVD